MSQKSSRFFYSLIGEKSCQAMSLRDFERSRTPLGLRRQGGGDTFSGLCVSVNKPLKSNHFEFFQGGGSTYVTDLSTFGVLFRLDMVGKEHLFH